VLDCINTIIGVLSPLRVDEIKYDLYGKLIGKCMPKETRKVLSSHYTKNTSAALLTNLLIETWDETVWDLACGSGTLLVASYNRKINLYEKIKGEIDKKDSIVLHKRFVEEDLTGMDIMPFACHLAGLNLSARNLNTRTNFIRIAHGNSLKFDCKKFPFDVDEAYGTVSNALEHFQSPQRSLDSFVENTPTPIKISPSTKFSVDKVDSVCINPPFTQYNKLPKKFREEFFRPELTKLFMKRTGLWACFLVLADKLIVDGGKIGAIVPVTFLRGEDPKGIRRYFLENYSFEYIIRPKINDCFSEDTGINDLIVIIKKTPPKRNKEVNIVFLNIPIDEFTISDIDAMIDRIKTVKDKEGLDDEFSLIKVKQEELNENIDQLMIYFFGKNLYNIKKINAFFEKIKDSNKTELIDIEKIRRGQQFRPKGESKRSIITRNYSKSRIKRATYYFDKDDSKFLKYYDKEGNEYEIDKQKLRKTFRTIIGIDKYDISDLYDYLIIKSDTPHAVGSQVIIAHKIKVKPKSPFFTSVYSDEKILPTDALTMYISSSDDESKIMSLYFSSIFYLIQFKRLDKKIKEDNLEIGEPEYKNIFIPNLEKISGDDINEILNYFEQNRNKKFPDIITQLKTKPQERVNLDKLFAKALSIKTSDEELFGIYDILLDEFQ